MVSRKNMKRRFNTIKERASKQSVERYKLDLEIKEYFGFHYEDKDNLRDDDSIIDTLDYGTSNLSFEDFEKLMKTNTISEAYDAILGSSVPQKQVQQDVNVGGDVK